MQHYSQKDPSYGSKRLGKSKLTVNGYGCLIVSLATLYQRHPTELMAVPGGVTDSGLTVTGVIAKACGGEAQPATKTAPKGWCIAMTDHYTPQGFPTHFFLVNAEKKLQIDPLDFPAQPEPLTYKIVEYRPFTNVKYVSSQTWQEETREWCIANGIITQWDTPEDKIMERVGAAIKNYHSRFNS